jgi:homoserine kinase type II
VAVYTQLDEVALQALWSAYDDASPLVRVDGIPHGSINTTYRLQTGAGVFFLRINEDKDSDDVWYEARLLEHLTHARLDVVTPTIRPDRAGERFFSVEERAGRPVWAALFEALPGADLEMLHVTSAHTSQIGRFLGKAHRALASFAGGRANPYGTRVVARWLEELVGHAPTQVVARRLAGDFARLRRERRLLPRGVIHGDLFVDNTKWIDGDLAAVFDWEMAGSDHMLLDVAIALLAWCTRAERAGLDPALCRPLIAGYQSVRRLAPSERRGFFVEAQLAAVRFTASRLRDFEMPRPSREKAARTHLDYRAFLARLDALQALGERAFLGLMGL